MFKKLVIIVLIVVVLIATYAGWQYFTANTAFSGKSKFLYIRTGHATWPEVKKTLEDSSLVKHPWALDLVADQLELPQKVRAGRYEIKNGMSLMDVARILRNNTQSPVNFVLIKVRTRESLAGMLGRKLELDSTEAINWLNNADSLQPLGFDTSTIMTMIAPNTYTFYWASSPHTIFNKFHDEYKKIWTPERREQARQQGLTPIQAAILASIVEEESNNKEDRDTIASVYLNRLRTGMRLQADPTVRFALRNFSNNRVYYKDLPAESPYNTYANAGLPPGPICTPSKGALEAVLNAPQTKYVYFVASSDFSGRHKFNEDFKLHVSDANEFRKALTVEQEKRKAIEQGALPK